MLYMRLPKINGFYHEVNMDESFASKMDDDWDAAYLCDGKQQGITYNFFYDGVNELSAFYKTDAEDIDEATFKYYEVDFGMDDWKERLINAMIEAYHEFWDGKEY